MPDQFNQTVLIEASWEVAHKDGGIYTVLTTKLQHARAHFPGRYIPVGGYRLPIQDFLESDEVPEEWRGIATNLGKLGITLHHGAWEVPGKPECILLDWREFQKTNLDELKKTLWDDYQLDTLSAGGDFDEPLAWSAAVGHFVAEYAAAHPVPILLHAHEWLSSAAILVAKQRKAEFKSVFTTHATVLGRALCSQDVFIYNQLDRLKPDEEAKHHNVVSKHQLERLGATEADVFTTVSEVTAKEAAAFLGRKPVVVENGIDGALFPTYDEIIETRLSVRHTIDNFVSAYFFPSYRFNVAATRYLFTMGRYEFKNKGYDLELAALGRLNAQLKEEGGDTSVVAFFFVPGDSLRIKPETTRQLVTYKHLSRLLNGFAQGEYRRVEREIWDDVECSCTLMPDSAREEARRLLDQVRTDSDPDISPFELRNPDQDAIMIAAKEHGLVNRQEDRVKLLFFPVYLDGFDGAFNLPLYDLVAGCDLGLFTSLYEPWGYTPVESIALGVPAITSTLAGFGQAIAKNDGVFVLDRDHADTKTETVSLTEMMRVMLGENDRTQVARRIAAYQSVEMFDWAKLYPKYLAAYQTALGKE